MARKSKVKLRRRLGPNRQRIGRLSADELLVHRELEYLRGCGLGTRSSKMAEKARKLDEAKKIARRHGSK